MALLIQAKLPATTIVETMVALSIVSIAFTVGMMIYFNVLDNSSIIQSISAENSLRQIMEATKQNKNFIEEEITQDGLLIQKTIQTREQSTELIWLHLEAIGENGKVIAALHELILRTE